MTFLCSCLDVLIVLDAQMGWRCGDTYVEADGDEDVDHEEQEHHARQHQLLCKQASDVLCIVNLPHLSA